MTDIAEQRELSLKFLTNTGLIPVLVEHGQKRPPGDFNPKAYNKDYDPSLTLETLRKGNYNIGALFSGKFVDLDIDNENPYLHAALHFFLPRSNYVWGRPSKPRSHFAYALYEDFDREKVSSILRYLKSLEAGVLSEQSMSLEVRGGKPESGMFTVMPGSWREDIKELVQWDAQTDMSVSASYVELYSLLKAIRLSVAAAAIAPHWGPGTRNDMSLSLAGLLFRIRVSALASYGVDNDEDAPDGMFVLSEKDAIDLLSCVMEITGDDHGDEASRILNLKNTWRKMQLESGARATGGKALAAQIGEPYGPKLVKGLYRLLSDNSAAEEIEAYMDQFVIWYGQGVLIDLDMVRSGAPRPFMLKQQAEVSLGGKKVKIGEKTIPLSTLLFNTALVQRVRGLTIDPSTDDIIVDTDEGKKVNTWRGFAIEPYDGKVTDKEIERFLSYVREVIADNDPGAYNWVLDWLADILQEPADKPGTALVLVGEHGAGKSFLGEGIMRPIIGPTHSTQTNKIDALTSQFNKAAENRIFVQCDESSHSGSRMAADALKSIISDKTIQIEPKGVDRYEAPNNMRLLFTSNREANAVFIDGSAYERRYTVLKVSSERAKDTEWWKELREWVDENLPKVMRWLLDRKYSKETIRRPHETLAKRLIQVNGLDPEVAYVIERLEQDFPITESAHEHWFDAYNEAEMPPKEQSRDAIHRDVWPDILRVGALEEDFRRWVRGRGHSVYGRSIGKLASFFNITSPPIQQRVTYYDAKAGKHIIARPRFYRLPSKEAVYKHLHSIYGDIVPALKEAVNKELDSIGGEGEY